MIEKNSLLQEFYRLYAKTSGTMYLDDVAEQINFAIKYVPLLLKAFPNDRDLTWQIRSYMRRAFRNAIRISCSGGKRSIYADDLAIKAGFHQYANGDIVSIFDCLECADVSVDPRIESDYDLKEAELC